MCEQHAHLHGMHEAITIVSYTHSYQVFVICSQMCGKHNRQERRIDFLLRQLITVARVI